MKKLLTIILATTLLLSVFLSAVLITPAQTTSMLVLGDSIAYGDGVAASQRYSTLIGNATGYSITNLAVCGNQTGHLVSHLNEAAYKTAVAAADIIGISIGGNNFLQLSSSEMQQAILEGANGPICTRVLNTVKADITTVLSKIRALNPSCTVYFQTLYNSFNGSTNISYQLALPTMKALAPKFNSLFYDLAKTDSNCDIVDVYTVFEDYYKSTKSTDLIRSDWIHPSVKGHTYIANAYLAAMGVDPTKTTAATATISTTSKPTTTGAPLDDGEYTLISFDDIAVGTEYAKKTIIGDFIDTSNCAGKIVAAGEDTSPLSYGNALQITNPASYALFPMVSFTPTAVDKLAQASSFSISFKGNTGNRNAFAFTYNNTKYYILLANSYGSSTTTITFGETDCINGFYGSAVTKITADMLRESTGVGVYVNGNVSSGSIGFYLDDITFSVGSAATTAISTAKPTTTVAPTTISPTTTTPISIVSTTARPTATAPTTTKPSVLTTEHTTSVIKYGDANSDKNVNAKDVLVIGKFLANWDVVLDKKAADCNADGTLNAKDVLLLLKYLANWKVVLGPQK